MPKLKITIVGGGNMGEAFIKANQRRFRLCVVEQHAPRAAFLKKTYPSISLVTDIASALASDVIILAVKPQDMDVVLAAIVDHLKGDIQDKMFLSIAAGLTTRYFESKLGSQARVIRCMPNMPAMINEGISGICKGKKARPADVALAEEILGSLGQTMVIGEDKMDALTAVSGSGPAYVFLFVESWMAVAMKLGFSAAQARLLVYQTLTGSSHLLAQAKEDAAALRAKVTSKGGTTHAAIEKFEQKQFSAMVEEALKAAANRAAELAR